MFYVIISRGRVICGEILNGIYTFSVAMPWNKYAKSVETMGRLYLGAGYATEAGFPKMSLITCVNDHPKNEKLVLLFEINDGKWHDNLILEYIFVLFLFCEKLSPKSITSTLFWE